MRARLYIKTPEGLRYIDTIVIPPDCLEVPDLFVPLYPSSAMPPDVFAPYNRQLRRMPLGPQHLRFIWVGTDTVNAERIYLHQHGN